MAIPRHFIEELQSRTSIAEVIGKFLSWDSSKSRPAAGDYWACCPFHAEKTPSFHVTESRGTYYCFGCGEKGGASTFLMKQRGMGFREAIEFLASEAGMTVPRETEQDTKKEKLANRLLDIHKRAASFYISQLQSPPGEAALNYLEQRGFGAEARQPFGIGYAADNDALLKLLKLEGFSTREVVDSGLAKVSDRGNGIYLTFRDRIVFPIEDHRGNVIAFGGRSMRPDVPAKYLNSPQTTLFNKGSVLYNFRNARKHIGPDSQLLVVEGYLDVVALWQAGFQAAVAPLGTAITASQLKQIWRLERSPIIALDGDEAGERAARRLLNVALPLLRPGYTLRFCTLPENRDPDDVLRSGGHAEMQKLLEASLSLADFIWESETHGRSTRSPDAKAVLKSDLYRKVGLIENKAVKGSYQKYLNDLYYDRIVFPEGRHGGKPRTHPQLTRQLRSELSSVKETAKLLRISASYFCEACLLAICIRCPDLATRNCGSLENLVLSNAQFQSLLDAVVEFVAAGGSNGDILRRELEEDYGEEIVTSVLDLEQVAIVPEVDGKSIDKTGRLFEELLERLQREDYRRALTEEIRSGSRSGTSIASPFSRLLEDLDTELEDPGAKHDLTRAETTLAPNGIAVPNSHIAELEAIVSSRSRQVPDKRAAEAPKAGSTPSDEFVVADNGVQVRKDAIEELKAIVGDIGAG